MRTWSGGIGSTCSTTYARRLMADKRDDRNKAQDIRVLVNYQVLHALGITSELAAASMGTLL